MSSPAHHFLSGLLQELAATRLNFYHDTLLYGSHNVFRPLDNAAHNLAGAAGLHAGCPSCARLCAAVPCRACSTWAARRPQRLIPLKAFNRRGCIPHRLACSPGTDFAGTMFSNPARNKLLYNHECHRQGMDRVSETTGAETGGACNGWARWVGPGPAAMHSSPSGITAWLPWMCVQERPVHLPVPH